MRTPSFRAPCIDSDSEMQHLCYTRLVHVWRQGAPSAFLAAVVAGFLASLGGTYWDAGWHTVRGRDEFLSPPHLLLYGGISLLGAVFALRALAVARAHGVRDMLKVASLRLGLVGASVTLAAAPIDDAWHRMFGRDAVIWSPPHMLGVIGTLAIAAAVLIEIRAAGPSRRWFEPLAGAVLLASCLVPVLEYDLDVPQFSPTFYLPVVATSASFAFALIRYGASGSYPATRAAAVYTAVIAALGIVLGAFGYPAPALPLLLPAAVAADRLGNRGPGAKAVLTTAALFAFYLPLRELSGPQLDLRPSAALAAFTLAALGSSIAFGLVRGGLRPRAGAAAVSMTTLVAFLALAPRPALAHDPGQGPEVGRAALTATASGRRARLDVDLGQIPDCSAVRPTQLRARRADMRLTSKLARTSSCAASGAITLPAPGRWFLYAELERSGKRLETWLPIDVGGSARTRDSNRLVYAPRARDATVLKVAAGVIVYALMLIVMTVVARSVRATAAP